MDPISLSIGTAALFSTCIECFEYFKAARGFEQHFEVLLVKLEYQQERLLFWGDLVGICNGEQRSVGPISESDHKHQELTNRCFDRIQHLLKDTETLKSKYGLRAYTSTSDTAPRSGISSNALKRFRLRLGRQSQGPSVLDKTRWAIHDETKFQKLIEDIRDSINGLTRTVPVSTELQDQKVQDDIASMVDDIQSLHLFQKACKDDYHKWWTAASAAIDASEAGTLDNRLADERLEQYEPSIHAGSGLGVEASNIPTHFGDQKVYLDTKLEIFFVLTESCRAYGSETPCDQLRLGTMCFTWQYSFLAPGSFRTRTAPGYRITERIDPSRFFCVDFNKYLDDQNAIKANAIANGELAPEENDRYRVKVYIYCSPCACQIATALDICEYRNNKTFVEFCIRIDHRQMTSCSASVSRVEGLISVIEYLKETEKGELDYFAVNRMKSIDREWLERQIYDYAEEDRLATLSPANRLARIAELHKSDMTCAAVILLGEADYSIPLMGVPPFRPSESGRLRETQLFRAWQKYHSPPGVWSWEREYMGTYTPKAPLPPRRVTPISSDTVQTSESTQRGFKRPRSLISDEEGS